MCTQINEQASQQHNRHLLTPAQHLRLVKSMRSHCDYLERCGIPPAARFNMAMSIGREHYAEISQ